MTSSEPQGTDALRPVAGRPDLRTYLSELAARRDYLLVVPREELRAQNLDTVLGSFWLLLDPIVQTAIYTLVFGVLLGVDRGIDNFVVYLLAGILTMGYLSQTLNKGANTMSRNRTLVRSLYFPRAVIPASDALFALYNYLPGFVVLLVVASVTGDPPTWRWLLLPVVLGLIFVFMSGLLFATARLGHHLPDLSNLVSHITRLLFYTSGAIFDPVQFSSRQSVLIFFEINPLYQYFSLLRWAVLGRPMPGWFWVSTPLISFGVLVLGFVYFWRGELSYGDER